MKQKLIEIREKLAVARQKLDELLDNPERTTEAIRTATKEVRELQIEEEAATTALEVREAEERQKREDAERDYNQGGRDNPETVEIRQLETRARVGNHIAAAMSGGQLASVEREHNEARKIPEDHVHLSMLAPAVESRATTDASGQTDQQSWLDRLFAQTAAMRLGIMMEAVGSGVAAYPVTKTGASAAQVARNTAAADSAWTVGITEAVPKRTAARVTISDRDIHRLPGLEAGLRRDLGMAMTEKIDRAVFVGAAGGDDSGIVGLTGTADVTEVTMTQANKDDMSLILTAIAGLVDGRHALNMGDVNIAWSQTAFKKLFAGVYATGFDRLGREVFDDAGLGRWVVREGIGADDSAGSFGAVLSLGRGLMGAAVCPIWESAQLVRDMYSGASSGDIQLVLNSYWDFKVLRPSNFGRVKFVA